MRSLMLAVAILSLSGPALAAPSFHEGTYKVEGTNLDGSAYSGTAEVKLLSSTTCAITWTTGQTTSFGQCMMMDGVVAAGYVLGSDVGLTMYHLNDDGSLDGAWTVSGKDGSGTEKLTPQN